MKAIRTVRVAMAGVLLLVASVLGVFLLGGELTLEQAWLSLVLWAFSAWTAWRARDAAGLAAALLLISVLVVLTGLTPSEAATLAPWLDPVVSSMWTGLFALFPFIFLHFALLFPILSKVMEGRRWLHASIYLPYALLIVLNRLDPDEWGGLLPVLAYPVGFLLGLGILLHKYRSSLTTSEKNRLWVLLIGCLAGALPRILTAWGTLSLPDSLESLAEITLLLFPISLMAVVLHQNFSEIGRTFRRLVVWTMVYGGLFNVYLIVFLAVDAAGDFPSSWTAAPSLASGSAVLLAAWPLVRWGRSMLRARFDPSMALSPAPDLAVPADDAGSEDGFQLIRPNPYIVGNPVRSPEMFFGRREEFEFIRRRLTGDREGGIIVLCGQRRAGKTSILYQLMQGRLDQQFLPVFVDMQGMVVSDDRGFLTALSELLVRGCKRHLAGFSLPASVGPAGDYRSFTALLEAILREIRQGRLLLLVDEYELIEDKVEKGVLSEEIFSYLNSLLEGFPRLSLVFTGSRPLNQSNRWQALLARSAFREISFLGREDARALIRNPLRGRVRLAAGSVNRLWRLGRGHPFFTQLLCQTLVDVLNERRQSRADDAAIEEVVGRVLEHPPPQLLYQWAGYRDEEKLALSSLATLLPSADAFLDPASCASLLATLPRPAGRMPDETRLRIIYERLRQGRFLDRDQTRYRFTMDLLRLWIRSERNVWNVLNEITSDGPEGT